MPGNPCSPTLPTCGVCGAALTPPEATANLTMLSALLCRPEVRDRFFLCCEACYWRYFAKDEAED